MAPAPAGAAGRAARRAPTKTLGARMLFIMARPEPGFKRRYKTLLRASPGSRLHALIHVLLAIVALELPIARLPVADLRLLLLGARGFRRLLGRRHLLGRLASHAGVDERL